MSDEQEERLDRAEKRRRERAVITDRRQLLDAFSKLPDHKIAGLDVSADVHDSLMLMRRLKPSGARARIIKNLSRRTEDEDWANIAEIVQGHHVDSAEKLAHDDFVVGLRDRLVAGDDEVLQEVRADHPNADHQRLRQLGLQARRNPESGPAKGARKKLLKALRSVYTPSNT